MRPDLCTKGGCASIASLGHLPATIGSHTGPSLANHTDATVEVVVARSQNCVSKLCYLLGPSQMSTRKEAAHLPSNFFYKLGGVGRAQNKMVFHLLVRVGGVEPPQFGDPIL